MNRLFCILIIELFVLSASAQSERVVKGEFVYHTPENVSLVEAKKIALEQARLNALAGEFGTIVEQANFTYMQNVEENSYTNFVSLGSSDVKGEWIEDTNAPQYDIQYLGESLIITCRVCGKAREVVSSKTDIQARVLRNGTDDKYESSQFKNGDDLFVSFRSPVKGYLAIYLVEDDENVQCLLPYAQQQDGIYQVEANRRYVLFNEDIAPQDKVDEYILEAKNSLEHYQIYVVFSPNMFIKAVDDVSGRVVEEEGIGGFPRELSFKNFHKWLAKCRRHDKDMCLKKMMLTVRK